jgi:solute carrier family 12 sodium/potassium/chloride transporter 2
LQTQLALLAILLVAIADYIIGTFIGPQNDEAKARGFVGFDSM